MAINVDDDKLQRILEDIHERLSAPALNGGFDKLMYKVEKIEETQDKILEKVSMIDETIYDPDNGLYARIKNVEASGGDELASLDKSIAEVRATCDSERKVVSDLTDVVSKKNEEIHDMQRKLDEIDRWKLSVTSTSRWLVVTVAGAAFSMLAKFVYDYLIGHIRFV